MICKRLFPGILLLLFLYIGPAGAESKTGGDFTLTDHNQNQFSLVDQRGKIVLLFFGYTYCPDVCPTELATISSVLRKFEEFPVQGVFVTVDPKRDSAEKLKEYVGYFNRELIGLTGLPEEIEKVKTAYRVRSTINRKSADDRYYSVDHTANLYVIDQQGELVNIVPYGFPAAHVVELVGHLLEN